MGGGGGGCRGVERREMGGGFWGWRMASWNCLATPPTFSIAVVVADGGQSLAYCHSPLKGQITSEHCLAGAGAETHDPPTLPHLPTKTLHHLLMYVDAHEGEREETQSGNAKREEGGVGGGWRWWWWGESEPANGKEGDAVFSPVCSHARPLLVGGERNSR